MIRVKAETEMTTELLSELITKHKSEANKLKAFGDAYKNEYDIFKAEKKPSWKPDNRIAVNFAKYLVDTFTGFFVGIPIGTYTKDEKVLEYIKQVNAYNFIEDNDSELARLTSIYGKAYEMLYVDEFSEIGIAAVSPEEAFIVYDDSILNRPMFFIRYYQDADGYEVGSYSDAEYVRHFEFKGGYKWTDEATRHGFDGVPAVEYMENTDRIGILDSVLSLINAYNKALSEKANDVDAFADAYLKILGTRVEQDDVDHIRSDRIINFEGSIDEMPQVDFLAKPSADGTQENLLERIERLIFTSSMIANINDDSFGTSSGIAIKYKLWGMSTEAKIKANKFRASMGQRYKLIFSSPLSKVPSDAWHDIDFTFTESYPANLLEEAQIAQTLAGITSEETQLSVLSIVQDPAAEMDKKTEENPIDLMGFINEQ